MSLLSLSCHKHNQCAAPRVDGLERLLLSGLLLRQKMLLARFSMFFFS